MTRLVGLALIAACSANVPGLDIADPTTAPWAEVFRRRIPGAAGQPHRVIANAGHFLQEEQGEALAEVLVDLMRRAS